jgi:hypothetical protein
MASNATESFAAIASSLDMQNMDVENVTDIVGAFGDTSGMDKIRKVALKQRLCEHCNTMRPFSIKVDGIVIRITNVSTEHDESAEMLRLEEGEVGCLIKTIRVDGQFSHTCNRLAMIDEKFEYIAKMIIDLVRERRICNLCDQLIVGMPGYDVCSKCALHEPDHKCCECNVKRGRTTNISGTGWEHPTCKRRRIMADSD